MYIYWVKTTNKCPKGWRNGRIVTKTVETKQNRSYEIVNITHQKIEEKKLRWSMFLVSLDSIDYPWDVNKKWTWFNTPDVWSPITRFIFFDNPIEEIMECFSITVYERYSCLARIFASTILIQLNEILESRQQKHKSDCFVSFPHFML